MSISATQEVTDPLPCKSRRLLSTTGIESGSHSSTFAERIPNDDSEVRTWLNAIYPIHREWDVSGLSTSLPVQNHRGHKSSSRPSRKGSWRRQGEVRSANVIDAFSDVSTGEPRQELDASCTDRVDDPPSLHRPESDCTRRDPVPLPALPLPTLAYSMSSACSSGLRRLCPHPSFGISRPAMK
jgi:hypothetical protein